jgi:ATP-dependent exoDNAse (exonuclease V) alpha subunit
MISLGHTFQIGPTLSNPEAFGMETAKLDEIVRQSNPLTKAAVEASIEGDARKALDALERGGGKVIGIADAEARTKAIAADYANLSAKEQSRTIVIDPSRAGRDALNAEIRLQMKEKGQLAGEAIAIRTLDAKGLTKAEARDARSYDVGDIVKFGRDYSDKGIMRQEPATVSAVDPSKNAVTLKKPDGQTVDWRPRQWGGAKSEAFTLGSIELMKGDRIEFTRNDREAGHTNGQRAEIISIDRDQNIARIRNDVGKVQTLDTQNAGDQHLRHGYVQTAYAAQGRTAERVMINADSRSTNLVDQKMMYVAVSRAKVSAAVYTDDRSNLVSALNERAGLAQTATSATSLSVAALQNVRKPTVRAAGC